jgi:hypothetical protein
MMYDATGQDAYDDTRYDNTHGVDTAHSETDLAAVHAYALGRHKAREAAAAAAYELWQLADGAAYESWCDLGAAAAAARRANENREIA